MRKEKPRPSLVFFGEANFASSGLPRAPLREPPVVDLHADAAAELHAPSLRAGEHNERSNVKEEQEPTDEREILVHRRGGEIFGISKKSFMRATNIGFLTFANSLFSSLMSVVMNSE